MANVQVIPRFRPVNNRERSEGGDGSKIVVDFDEDGKGLCVWTEGGKKPNRFTFDHVFPPTSTQLEVFNTVAQPLVKEVFNGYNTTIFAYGQTGSGKTHTMMGDPNDPDMKGIIPRMIEAVFDGIAQADPDIEFTVKVSYVEIYNEKIRDLLDESKTNLRVRESPMGVWIEDVTEVYVGDTSQVYQVMAAGAESRAKSATNMNAESSRSHSVFIITLGQRNTVTGLKRGGKLTLVDLAGSEKVAKTGAEGQTLEEAKHINKSLSALGNVINALTSAPESGKPLHVPYRDSKLTYLLSDSLGGNSKTCLIITGSPCQFNVDETLSTIRFGNRAKNIKNKPKVNQEKSVAEYQRLLNLANAKIAMQDGVIRSLEQEVGALRQCLAGVKPEHLTIPIPHLYAHGIEKLRQEGVFPASAGTGAEVLLSNSNPEGDTNVSSIDVNARMVDESAAEEKRADPDVSALSPDSQISESPELSVDASDIMGASEMDSSTIAEDGKDEDDEDLTLVWGAEADEGEDSTLETKADDAESEQEQDQVGDLPKLKKTRGKAPDFDRRVSSLTLSKSTRELIASNLELEAERDEALRRTTEMETELQELRRTTAAQMREAENELAQLRHQIEEVQRQRAAAEQVEQLRISELERLREEAELDNKRFELELAEMVSALKQSRTASEDAEKRATQLQSQLADASKNLELAKAHSAELQSQLEMLRRQLDDVHEEKKREEEARLQEDAERARREAEEAEKAQAVNLDDLFGGDAGGYKSPTSGNDQDIMSVMDAYSLTPSNRPGRGSIVGSSVNAAALEQQLIDAEHEKQRLNVEIVQLNSQVRTLAERVDLLAQQLRRKSDECLDAHLALVARKEHIASLEEHLAKARRVAQEDAEKATKTIEMLQEKFFVVEAWCQELYNCACYWRKQSNRYRQTIPGGGASGPISIRGHGAPSVAIPGGGGTSSSASSVPTPAGVAAAVETDFGARRLREDLSAVRMPSRQYNPGLAASLAAERKAMQSGSTTTAPASTTPTALQPPSVDLRSTVQTVNGAQVIISPQGSPAMHWSKVFMPTSDGKVPSITGRARSGSVTKAKGADMSRFF